MVMKSMASIEEVNFGMVDLQHTLTLSTGKSDPYAVFSLSGQKVFKSQTKKKTLNPEWNENFVTSVVRPQYFHHGLLQTYPILSLHVLVPTFL